MIEVKARMGPGRRKMFELGILGASLDQWNIRVERVVPENKR
jgi:hypothetical protein